MSHSVPSESSASDTTFIVGADLVQFDRHDLPIYQTPDSQWAEACFDEAPYGAPLDRVFGEPGDLHIDGVPHEEQQTTLASLTSDDPLVVLGCAVRRLDPSGIRTGGGDRDGLRLRRQLPIPSFTCTTAGAGTSPAPTGPSTSTPEPERFGKSGFPTIRIELLDDPRILAGRHVDVERCMTEPGIEQTQGPRRWTSSPMRCMTRRWTERKPF